ncbi:hypothetical protein WN944_026054 [Citrus x changshan-huyou]|uniref:Uncharacterized protein n=1 Tax=Citrus x changshan-huyou TaxID=2935761 RepID=A0AAP0LUE0_9ROSI
MPSKVLPSLREKHDEYDLLRELLKSWANHKFLVKWLSRVFLPLQPPYRPRKVPIESLRTGRHFHSIIAVDYWPESRLLKPQNFAVKPHCFAAVPPVLGEATSWILFPTIPSVLSDHPLNRELPCPGRSAVGKFMALGARSATVAARRSSPPPPPSDSAWLELSG